MKVRDAPGAVASPAGALPPSGGAGVLLGWGGVPQLARVPAPAQQVRGDAEVIGAWLKCCASPTDMQYDEDDDEITPDLWQEACWIVIRWLFKTRRSSCFGLCALGLTGDTRFTSSVSWKLQASCCAKFSTFRAEGLLAETAGLSLGIKKPS